MPVPYGLGKHVEDVPPEQLKTMLFWFWLSIWNYYCAAGFAKLSILLQYLRIFGTTRKFRTACYCVIASVIFYILWGAFSTAFYCFPPSGFWDPEAVAEGRAHCQKQWTVKLPIWFFNAAMNMATDIATAVLPLPVIKNLNLPRKQRLTLMFVFGIGGRSSQKTLKRIRHAKFLHRLHNHHLHGPPFWSVRRCCL